MEKLTGERELPVSQIPCRYLSPRYTSSEGTLDHSSTGQCLLTTYRLQYVPAESSHALSREYFDIPWGSIRKIRFKKNAIIQLKTTDLRKVELSFELDVVKQVLETITNACYPPMVNPSSHSPFYANHRLPRLNDPTTFLSIHDGWDRYDPVQEYTRQGILDSEWKMSHFNQGFQAIPSYPETLVFPASVTDQTIRDSQDFRSLGRVPSLSWFNRSNGAALCRSSQPRVGLKNAISKPDQLLVSSIALANTHKPHLHIIDCRPKSYALANRAKGYGFEPQGHYPHSTIMFMDIPNIHAMRESWKKLRNLMLQMSPEVNLSWGTAVEETKWLMHLRLILKAACTITSLLEKEGTSVLVHCSHGWDRTPQLTALAQILVDPYFRTLEGFQVLIEKDFLSFGHPFHTRLRRHGERLVDTNQESPVFIQFLDCVWQLVHQYPHAFEFNAALLPLLADHVHQCRFGTFLFDTARERVQAQLRDRTVSVWSYVQQLRHVFCYQGYDASLRVLLPQTSSLLRHVTLWHDLHSRYALQSTLIPGSARSASENWPVDFKLPKSILAVAQKATGLQAAQPIVDKIQALEKQLKALQQAQAQTADVSI